MLVYTVSTLEKLLEVIIADNKGDRQSDGTPEGVSSPNPVPELEHIFLRNPECGHGLGVGAESDEVLSNVSLVLCGLEEPVSGTLGVGDRLLSGECLACNDEECRLWIAGPQGLGEVGSIDVRDEAGSEVPLGISLESLGDHNGTQVRTTDTNVDNGIDGLSGVSLPSTVSNGLGKLFYVLKYGRNLTDAFLSDLVLVKVTEGDVEDGTILGRIDMLSGEHLVPIGLHLGLPNELEEGVEDGFGNQVFGIIQEEGDRRIARRDVFLAEFLVPVRILGEEVF